MEVRLSGFEQDVVSGTVTAIPMYPRIRSPYGTEIKEYWLEATLTPTEAQWENMHPQMDAEVKLAIASISDAITVPKSSVVREGSQNYVWLQHGDDLMKCAVRPGNVSEDKVVIQSGLRAGDRILQHPPRATKLPDSRSDETQVDGQPLKTEVTNSLAVSGNAVRG